MVRADEFQESSVSPEEYTVQEDEEETEYLEETRDVGITVAEGDDMSPIIMDANEEIVVGAEEIDRIIHDNTVHKNEVIEYPINIRPEEERSDEDVEIL